LGAAVTADKNNRFVSCFYTVIVMASGTGTGPALLMGNNISNVATIAHACGKISRNISWQHLSLDICYLSDC
jgi:hypothetical protein